MSEWRNILISLSYFTRIPVRVPGKITESDLNNASKYFPLVGIFIGILTAAVFVLCQFIFPLSISVIISMIFSIILTGAFHEDGLSDFVDGFGGGYTKESVLRIMKDSRIGSFGAIGITLILLLKFVILNEMNSMTIPLVLIAGHSISRFITITFLFTHSYARENEDSKAKPMAKSLSLQSLLLAALFGLLPILLLPNILGIVVIVFFLFFIKFLMGFYFVKKIGGYTGDCLGAVQQITEVLFYLGALLVL